MNILKLGTTVNSYLKSLNLKSITQTKPYRLEQLGKGNIKDLQPLPTIYNTTTKNRNYIRFSNPNIKIKQGDYPKDFEAFSIPGNKLIGKARISYNQQKDIFGYPPSLYVDFIATKPGYKGVGSEMMKHITKISKANGYNGNVSLLACTGSVPSDFASICGYSKMQDMSSTLKYYKMGFRTGDPILNKNIENEIKNGSDGFRTVKSFCGSGKQDKYSPSMDLSPDAIVKRHMV